MQMFRRVLVTTLAVLVSAPMAWAQQTHVVNKTALDQAVQQRVSRSRQTAKRCVRSCRIRR